MQPNVSGTNAGRQCVTSRLNRIAVIGTPSEPASIAPIPISAQRACISEGAWPRRPANAPTAPPNHQQWGQNPTGGSRTKGERPHQRLCNENTPRSVRSARFHAAVRRCCRIRRPTLTERKDLQRPRQSPPVRATTSSAQVRTQRSPQMHTSCGSCLLL